MHLTGWKTGYIVAPEKLLEKVLQLHQFNVFSVNSFAQEVIASFLSLDKVKELTPLFKEKQNLFLDGIKNSRFKAIPSKGTYFQLLDYSEVSDLSDDKMALELIEKHKIASSPISSFYEDGSDNKKLRFCLAKNDTTLLKATEILCQI